MLLRYKKEIDGKMHDNHLSSTTELQDFQPSNNLVATPDMISPNSTPDPGRNTVDGSSSNLQDAGSDGKSDKPKPPTRSVSLERSVYIVLLVLLYGAAALYAWVVICILTHRPIGGNSYTPDEATDLTKEIHPFNFVSKNLDVFFARSEKHLRAARIIQSVVSALTIPLTSAVCSQAAVVYTQKKRGNNHLTLRQSMALGDKGWADIVILKKLFFGGWSKYRTSLLLFALFLHILGFAISPIQQIFLSYTTIKRVASTPTELPLITSFADLFPDYGSSGYDIVKLRSKLASAVKSEVQPRLWSSSNSTVAVDDRLKSDWSYSSLERKSQNTLANISTITDPFWAQLPPTTNTGLLRQVAPRINSTATWENNSAATLPADCRPSSDALYLYYKFEDHIQYNFEICVPGNMSESPWKNQNSRQDFTEELYLRMNFSGNYRPALPNGWPDPGLYSKKLTLRTTSGYFELPNYANGQVPGPLLEEDPFYEAPELRSQQDLLKGPSELRARNLDEDLAWNTVNISMQAMDILNKGPLLSTTLALFGEASLADVQHTALAAYGNSSVLYYGCIGLVPLVSLLFDPGSLGGTLDPCLKAEQWGGPDDPESNEQENYSMHALVAAYFWLLAGDSPNFVPSDYIQNAFTAAAFLANDEMMMHHHTNLIVSYSMGTDIDIPQISRAGIIFISVLLGLDLSLLLALAVYGAWNRRWTGTLDSFAMMRIGASIADKTPLLATRHTERIKDLDEIPGWIGNESEPGVVGKLCLGGDAPLKKTKRYVSYDTDYEAESLATKRRPWPFRLEGYSLAPGERV